MGKVFKNKECNICHTLSPKVIEAWGIKYCPVCFEKRPKSGRPGNSGMISDPNVLNQGMFAFDSDIHLIRVPKGDKKFATLFLSHYPESKGIVGRQCNYLVERAGVTLGIVGANSPPLHYKLFEKFFPGYTEDNWLNNNVYRLIVNEPNLGTRVLRMFRERIKKDYETQYKHELVGMVTFVEPPRTGAMYKADNWTYLGITQGVQCKRRGLLDKWVNKEWSKGTKKHIYARWIIKQKQRKGGILR